MGRKQHYLKEEKLYSGLQYHVVWQKSTDVAEERIASKCLLDEPKICRRHVPPKLRAFSEPHGFRTRTTALVTVSGVRFSSLSYRFSDENNVYSPNTVRSTRPAHPTVLHLITEIFGEDHKLRPSSLCSFRHPYLTFSYRACLKPANLSVTSPDDGQLR
jgi:hypothetical protein